jgi:glycerophosphoryl diester phosphodiesterase
VGDSFDLQAHRGGAGLAAENTLRAFGNALALGVSTLELDVHVSLDRRLVVRHDRILPDGEFLAWLPAESAGVPLLDEVFALARERGADEVRFNIETKFDPTHPDEDAPRELFADLLTDAIVTAGLVERVSVQSFDWACLDLVHANEPRLGLNVLTNTNYQEIGLPGASPWMAGVDIDDFGGDVVRAASGRGYTGLSPRHTLLTREMIDEAHRAGLQVIPYTVDDPGVMDHLVDLGVDGLITNRPDIARDVMAARGMPLPRAHPAAG